MAEYPWWQRLKPDDILETQYSDLLHSARCKDLTCLRNQTGSMIAQAAQESYSIRYKRPGALYGYGDFYYGPSVDGKVIQGLPSVEFAKGHFSPVRYSSLRYSSLIVTDACSHLASGVGRKIVQRQ
jgi:hypothetical protein